MDGKEYRVGVLGARRGRSLLTTFQNRSDCKVVVVGDINPESAKSLAQSYNVENTCTDMSELLSYDLDIVVVATPPQFHTEQSIAGLQAGCHVLCEVPAVWTVDEGRELVKAVRASDKVYMMAENCNFWAFIEAWRGMIEKGRLGTLMYAEAEYIHDCYFLTHDANGNPTWRATLPPIHYCTHSLGPILSFAKDRCVSATGLGTGAHVRPDHGSHDMEVGLFKTASGMVIKILTGFSVVREPSFHYYSVYGSEGVLETTRGAHETQAFLADIPNLHAPARLPLDYNHVGLPAHAMSGGHGTAEYMMVQGFMDAVKGKAANPVDVYTALDCTLPGIIADQSAQRGGVLIEVPNPREF